MIRERHDFQCSPLCQGSKEITDIDAFPRDLYEMLSFPRLTTSFRPLASNLLSISIPSALS
jgi:hypothetical protein